MSRFHKETSVDAGQGDQSSKPKLCVVCNEQPGKYKCARCARPYCSVACHKLHQENHPPDPEPPQVAISSYVYVPREDSKPEPGNKFSFLDNSEELKRLCAKYPHLPELIAKIGEAGEPVQPSTSQRFTKTGPAHDDATWRREQGKKRGRAALEKAMMIPGPNGDAIREYHETILYLLNKQKNA